MIEKCAMNSINNNMHYIGLIILVLIVCIVFLYYIKMSTESNEKIIEKYNSDLTRIKHVNAPYLNTEGANPQIQDVVDIHKSTRYPTANDEKISTGKLRNCQIHFNNDKTSSYHFEDGWKELDTIISDENQAIYKIPFKKFGIQGNNVTDFTNFNETSRCFKEKDINPANNKYRYKANDLIKYKLDSYVAINTIKDDNTTAEPKLFMQMNFEKQDLNNASDAGVYVKQSIDSICSYNYNTNLNISNELLRNRLYRLTIVKNNTADVISAIDIANINDTNNSIYTIDQQRNDKTTSFLYDLLAQPPFTYYSIRNGSVFYNVNNNKIVNQFINVTIFKFNRNLICDNTIKSYETHGVRLAPEKFISYTPYLSAKPINEKQIPTDELANEHCLPKGANERECIAQMIDNEKKTQYNGFSDELLSHAFNVNVANLNNINNNNPINNADLKYRNNLDLLSDMYYFIHKLIVMSNNEYAKQIILKQASNTQNILLKNNFITSINTLSKYISMYSNSGITNTKTILEAIANGKQIDKDKLNIEKYPDSAQIVYDTMPFDTLEYETKIYTLDTIDKTFTLIDKANCDILIVGGGGGGGGNYIHRNGFNYPGGGGGAGALIYLQNTNMNAGTYNITIGNGGKGGATSPQFTAKNGGNTIIQLNDTVIYRAIGGGAGGTWGIQHGQNGGSGGGTGYTPPNIPGYPIDTNNIPSGFYGNHGGQGYTFSGGGGGGAGSPGTFRLGGGGMPGAGKQINIKGFNEFYAGGGGGAERREGGSGIGGVGETHGGLAAGNGAINTGSGGGGGYKLGGDGGSGIVIIRYLKQPNIISNNRHEFKPLVNSKLNNNIKSGLYFKIYNGYYNDVLNYTTLNGPKTPDIPTSSKVGGTGIVQGITHLMEGTNNIIAAENTGTWEHYTVEWQGYFYAQISGQYGFATESDDASHLWVGDGAIEVNANKITVDNGRPHGRHRVNSPNPPTLQAGVYYPLRILFGEQGGGDNMTVYFLPPGHSTWIINGTGWFFHIPGREDLTYIDYYNINQYQNTIIKMKTRDLNARINNNKDVVFIKNRTYRAISFRETDNKVTTTIIEDRDSNPISDINTNTTIYQMQDTRLAKERFSRKFNEDTLCYVVIVAGGGSGGENGGCEGGGGGGGGGVICAYVLFKKNVEYFFEIGNGGLSNNSGVGNDGHNSRIYDNEGTMNIVAYGGGGGGFQHGRNGGSGGGGSGHGGHWDGGKGARLGTAEKDKKGAIELKSYGNDGGKGWHAGFGGAGAGGGGASDTISGIGESLPQENRHNGCKGGDGIRLVDIKSNEKLIFASYSRGIGVAFGGGGGGASGMNCTGDYCRVTGGARGGLGGIGGGGKGGHRRDPQAGTMGLGGGGGGSSCGRAANGGSGVIYIWEERTQNLIYESNDNNLSIIYNVDDASEVNLTNARNTKVPSTSSDLIPLSGVDEKTWEIGTKVGPYAKFRINIMAIKLGDREDFYNKNKELITNIEISELEIASNNGIHFKRFVILFKDTRHYGGIDMKLSGYNGIFSYRSANFAYINSNHNINTDFNLYFSSKIKELETNLNILFDLNGFNESIRDINNQRTSLVSPNSERDGFSIRGPPLNTTLRTKLNQLIEAYNSIIKYDSDYKFPDVKFNNSQIGIRDVINNYSDNYISHEAPDGNTIAPNYNSTFNLNEITKKYIYFKYPM